MTHPCIVTCKSFPQWQRLSDLLRTVANGCERLRTVADGCEHRSNGSRTRLYPQTPRVKREPFATHSGKKDVKRRANDSLRILKAKNPRFTNLRIQSCFSSTSFADHFQPLPSCVYIHCPHLDPKNPANGVQTGGKLLETKPRVSMNPKRPTSLDESVETARPHGSTEPWAKHQQSRSTGCDPWRFGVPRT